MTFDTNPSFHADTRREAQAIRVSNLLWEACKGDFSKVPRDYLESLSFEYSDGSRSVLGLLDRVDFSGCDTFEEFFEVVEHLVKVDPDEWPDEDSVISVQGERLLYEDEPDISDFSEDFSSPASMSRKVELFLKKVIASVYRDGVRSVTDNQGNPPNEGNGFLMSPDGKSFSGIFYDSDRSSGKKFPFVIQENNQGNFEIKY